MLRCPLDHHMSPYDSMWGDKNIDGVWQNFSQAKGTSSAIKPALILAGICVPSGLSLAGLGAAPFNYFGITLAVGAVAFVMWQIAHFTIRDPDRLHNERHIEAKLAMGLIGQGPEMKRVDNSQVGGNPVIDQGQSE